MSTAWLTRAVTAGIAPVLAVTGMTVVAAPADAASTMSTRSMLTQLDSSREHVSGYDRGLFSHWADADGDGCDARDEVLLQEAVDKPQPGSVCGLGGGQWSSLYDGDLTRDASTFDVDHMVPLNEAWQSGAWGWSGAKRKAYANDLGYRSSLIAVSASSNRSKSDLEPQDWMPERAAFRCTYLARWVAVKYRWDLAVNGPERAFLRSALTTCGWPRAPRPGTPSIPAGSTGNGGGGGGGGSTGGGGSVGNAVHPGAFCAEHWSYGYTSAGTTMRCTTTPTDSRFRWRSA